MSQSKSYTFKWKLSPKQRKLFESNARFRIGMGGRRFGKNEVETAVEVDFALSPGEYSFGADNPADILVWHVAPTYRQAHRHGYRKVLEKLPESLIKDHGGSEYSPSHIELITGAKLEFLSYDNPKGLQGEGVDLICGDEWAYSDSKIWDADLRPMLLDSGGGAVLISKPLGENHFYEKYVRGTSPEMPYSDGSNREDGWFSVHATSYDNPLIPDDEIDSVKEVTPDAIFRQEYLADPTSGGKLLTTDMLSYEPADVLNSDTGWKWHVAVDLGIETNSRKARQNDTDYWAMSVVAEHPFEDHAFLVDQSRRRGQSPAQAAEWIAGEIQPWDTTTVKYEAVQAQAWFERDLKDAGLRPVPYTPDSSKEDRILHMSVLFNSDKVKLIDWDGFDHYSVDWGPFESEWRAFPDGNHDDVLDSTAMALEGVNFSGVLDGISGDMYRRNDE